VQHTPSENYLRAGLADTRCAIALILLNFRTDTDPARTLLACEEFDFAAGT
jgi:hypothetical protein